MKKSFLTKTSAIIVILLFIGLAVTPVSASYNSSKIQNDSNIFKIQSVVNIVYSGYETRDPISPGETVTIPLTISYRVTRGILGKNILDLMELKNKKAIVSLEIVEESKWCKCTLDTDKISMQLSENEQYEKVDLSIFVKEYAPNVRLGFIKIKANVNTIPGPFGLYPIVESYSKFFTINFLSDSIVDININPEIEFIKVTPGEKSDIQIQIENLGNCRTIVYAKIIESPNDWKVLATSHVSLEIDEKENAYVVMRPPQNFTGIKIIEITFRPVRADYIVDEGDIRKLSILAYYLP